MHVVSVSRRTDVSAFYSKWFLSRLQAGFCEWVNPFGGQMYRVSLQPADVLGIVFWTRFPGPMIPHLRRLCEHFHLYFHVSITGYGPPLELHNPPLEKAIDSFHALSDTISPELSLWRYDPVVVSNASPPEYHVKQFSVLAKRLEGFTRRCYVSFVDTYGKTRRNLSHIDSLTVADPSRPERLDLIHRLRDVGNAHGITLHACCEDALVGSGVEKARCVDLELLNVHTRLRRKPSRAECGCIESVDIGAYDTCRFGCAYCYATNSTKAAEKRARAHDPNDSLLWRPRIGRE